MVAILVNILGFSLLCSGITLACRQGYILFWHSQFCERLLPIWINKPLWACPPCMGSLYGILCWYYTFQYQFINTDAVMNKLTMLPFICFALSAANELIFSIIYEKSITTKKTANNYYAPKVEPVKGITITKDTENETFNPS